MKLGVFIFPTPETLQPVTLAREAEARGFESLFLPEHTHIPASRRTPFPAGGELPPHYWRSADPLIALACAAAATERIRLGTGVCLIPEHDPILLAKQVATLDALSGGRFVLGIGGGWNAEEMEHHGVAFADRWKVTRERVLAMKAIWTQQAAEYHGRFVDFEPIWAEPKPVQKPHPPIWIGASTRHAIRRVVEWGDGWLPIYGSCNLARRAQQIAELCAELGRDPATIEISVFGAPPDPARLEELAKAGAQRAIFMLPSEPPSDVLRRLDRCAKLLSAG